MIIYDIVLARHEVARFCYRTRSSNGRTLGFGPSNRGSSPCRVANIQKTAIRRFFVCWLPEESGAFVGTRTAYRCELANKGVASSVLMSVSELEKAGRVPVQQLDIFILYAKSEIYQFRNTEPPRLKGVIFFYKNPNILPRQTVTIKLR